MQLVLRCAACGPYPVLGGVPILVVEPAAWCATFHDAALAALAEHGLATREAVATLTAFAGAAPGVEPARFGDDWTEHELEGRAAPGLVPGPAAEALSELLDAPGPSQWLLERVPARSSVLEVGCGAGLLSERLARTAKTLVVGDLSLRAVLTSRVRSAAALGVVFDAQALPFAAGTFDLLIAENVADLLDEPLLLLEGAARVAKRALLSTPGQLQLSRLARRAGLVELERADGVPWTRRLSSRHLEVYLVQVLSLSHR